MTAAHLGSQPAVELQAVQQVMHLEVRLEQGLALLGGEQLRNFRGVLPDQLTRAGQSHTPIFGRRFCPVGERFSGGVHRLVDVLGIPHRHPLDKLTRGRVTNLIGPARGGANAFTTDQHAS